MADWNPQSDDWQTQRSIGPRQYRALIASLRMTQTGAGRYLGVSARTAARYASGDAEVPPPAVMLLRALEAYNIEPLVPRAPK